MPRLPTPSVDTPSPAPTSPAAASSAKSPSRLQMADIARLAGVSVSTVSRALSGSPLVNKLTRDRVAELARSLNYAINVGAQNLRLGHNRTVAVIVPFDPATRQHLSDPFFLAMIGSIADALTDRGYDMLLSRVDANELDRAAQFQATGRAIGIILIGQWRHHDQLNAMAQRGVPLVVWGAQLSQQLYATVGGRNVEGGEQATAHLLAGGARRVVFLGDPELPEIGLRYEGYLRAHQAAGLVPDPALMRRVAFVREAVRAEVQALHAQAVAFDAVFAASDLLAMTAISTLAALGVNVPGAVRVVGYDDIELAAHFHPPLSTVRQPMVAAGEALVDSLLSQLAGARPAARLLETDLVVRASSMPI